MCSGIHQLDGKMVPGGCTRDSDVYGERNCRVRRNSGALHEVLRAANN